MIVERLDEMTPAAWNITLTRMFAAPIVSAYPGHRPTRARGSFGVLWGCLLHGVFFSRVHGHPGPSQCRYTPITSFIHQDTPHLKRLTSN